MTNEDLSDCAGYRVEMRDGSIGSIAAVLARTGRKEPGVLVVHSDLLSCRLSAVPVDEVENVDLKHRRIVLRARRPDLAPTRTQ
jgi:hypothetical protein